MKKSQIVELIKKEINWHRERDDSSITRDYREGFIKGLKQALSLVKNIKNE